MGQAATLYSVNNEHFQRIILDPNSFSHQAACGCEVFDKTFKGLEYILSRGCDAETIDMVAELFEPSTFLGQKFDYAEIDWENEADKFLQLESERIYYHHPTTVRTISNLLNTVTDDVFLGAFDPEEMNQLGIYPEVWSRNTAAVHAFNGHAILQEFHRLKYFFAQLSSSGNYCVCCIG